MITAAGIGETRAVREQLADLGTATPDPVGIARRTPKTVSTTDPATAFRGRDGLSAASTSGSTARPPSSSTPAPTDEGPITACRMVERGRERHGVDPWMLVADMGGGSSRSLDKLQRQGIAAHIPLTAPPDGTGKGPPAARRATPARA